jgi:hypothetical protein
MKYVILGKLDTKYNCDFTDTESCIISMNKHWDDYLIPRVDIWFDLHNEPQNKHAQFTKTNFPFEDCHKLVQGKRFCSTAAYLIAWCVLQGATKIEIHGMQFKEDGNPRRKRELHNVREMLFYCMGRGIELDIDPMDLQFLFPEHITDDDIDFDQ